MTYLARKNNTIFFLSNSNGIDDYVANGWDIVQRDETGKETVLATNGKWIAPMPSIEEHSEISFPANH